MRRFIRENRRMLILAAVALMAGMVIGVFLGLNMPREDDAATVGRLGVRSVLPGMELERRITYTRCAHETVKQLDPAAFIGYTREELAAFYSGDAVVRFDEEGVVILHTVAGCCPEHVILHLGTDEFTVSRTDPESFSESLLHTLPLDEAVSLTAEERAALAEGLVFDTLGEIDAYLESMES